MWVVFRQREPSFREEKVDQSCPDFNFLDPSLLPGAAGSSSVKPDVVLCWFGTRLLFFISNGETLESWKGEPLPL